MQKTASCCKILHRRPDDCIWKKNGHAACPTGVSCLLNMGTVLAPDGQKRCLTTVPKVHDVISIFLRLNPSHQTIRYRIKNDRQF